MAIKVETNQILSVSEFEIKHVFPFLYIQTMHHTVSKGGRLMLVIVGKSKNGVYKWYSI